LPIEALGAHDTGLIDHKLPAGRAQPHGEMPFPKRVFPARTRTSSQESVDVIFRRLGAACPCLMERRASIGCMSKRHIVPPVAVRLHSGDSMSFEQSVVGRVLGSTPRCEIAPEPARAATLRPRAIHSASPSAATSSSGGSRIKPQRAASSLAWGSDSVGRPGFDRFGEAQAGGNAVAHLRHLVWKP